MYSPIKLPVPYVSQFGSGADAYGKDCGPACSVMLLAAYTSEYMTPDEFYRAITTTDTYITKSQLQTVLQTKGVETERLRDWSLNDLYQSLAAGKPSIALINYGALREHIATESTFTGPHFVLVVGMDDHHVYIHDSLWREQGGAWLSVPHAAWLATWERAKEQLTNPPCSVLVPTRGLTPLKLNARVFAYWEETEYYYSATLIQSQGPDRLIHYDDGTEEWTTDDYLEPLSLAVGQTIECLFSDGYYYTATVTRLAGERVEVEYDDGSREWTTFKKLRVWYE